MTSLICSDERCFNAMISFFHRYASSRTAATRRYVYRIMVDALQWPRRVFAPLKLHFSCLSEFVIMGKIEGKRSRGDKEWNSDKVSVHAGETWWLYWWSTWLKTCSFLNTSSLTLSLKTSHFEQEEKEQEDCSAVSTTVIVCPMQFMALDRY